MTVIRKFHLAIFILLTAAVVLVLLNTNYAKTAVVVAMVAIYGLVSYLLGYRTRG